MIDQNYLSPAAKQAIDKAVQEVKSEIKTYFEVTSNFYDYDERLVSLENIGTELRLIKLEQNKNYQIEENRKISKRVDELEERLKKYTDRSDIHESALNRKWDANSELSKRLNDLETQLNTVRSLGSRPFNPKKTPHKCPVCHGEGMFHIQSMEELTSLGTAFIIDALGRKYKKCHACEGKGLLWG